MRLFFTPHMLDPEKHFPRPGVGGQEGGFITGYFSAHFMTLSVVYYRLTEVLAPLLSLILNITVTIVFFFFFFLILFPLGFLLSYPLFDLP